MKFNYLRIIAADQKIAIYVLLSKKKNLSSISSFVILSKRVRKGILKKVLLINSRLLLLIDSFKKIGNACNKLSLFHRFYMQDFVSQGLFLGFFSQFRNLFYFQLIRLTIRLINLLI